MDLNISVNLKSFRICSPNVLSSVSKYPLLVNLTRLRHIELKLSVVISSKVRDRYCSESFGRMILIEYMVFTTHMITRTLSYDSTLILTCLRLQCVEEIDYVCQ